MLDGDVEGLGDLGRRALTVTMSGRGTMTSRATVSPNSMIYSMSSALLVLDDLVLGRGLHDAEQLLLRDERALLQALARDQPVRHADEARGEEPQRRERHEPQDRPSP